MCVLVFVQSQMKMKSAGVVDGGLFTESYCNICNAQLISESQRTAHYEVRLVSLSFGIFFLLFKQSQSNFVCRKNVGNNTAFTCRFVHCTQPCLYQFMLVLFKIALIHYTQTSSSMVMHTSVHTHTHLLIVYLSVDLQGCIMNDH